MRTLIQQQIELYRHREGHVGAINLRTDARGVVQEAVDLSRDVCFRALGEAPDVEIVTVPGGGASFPYIDSYLSYAVSELLKNSLRATIETHGLDNPPKVVVAVADKPDSENISIMIADQGGGVPLSVMPRLWSYLYSTAKTNPIEMEAVEDSAWSGNAPLAGFGHGLGLSRCYARAFGGDLRIASVEGYGTNAFLYIPRLSIDGSAQDKATQSDVSL